MIYRGFDASTDIPASAPAGFDAVFGYVGGDTPHVWTREQWARFEHLRQFPIWVDDVETTDPAIQAAKCVTAVKSLGWSHDRTRIVWLDVETKVNPAWVNEFGGQLYREGYFYGVYGAADFASKTGAPHLWVANGSVNPELSSLQVVLAYQVYFDVKLGSPPGGTVDISLLSPELMKLGGVGPRS
jgi:hypothetical protein